MGTRIIRVYKHCTGAKQRLYKAVRLWTLYLYKYKNHGWGSKKYADRYKRAHLSMEKMIIRILLSRFGQYKYWKVEAVGSKSALDLTMDRGLVFVVILGDDKDEM